MGSENATSWTDNPRRGSERRRHGRLACDIHLTARAGSERAEVTALDLSVSGARVVLPSQWSGNREIALSGSGIRLNSTVRAQVVWVRPWEDGTVLAGLHFLEDPAQLESTWAHLHLRKAGWGRRRRYHRAFACELPVTVHRPGRGSVAARLVSLSAVGAHIDGLPYQHLGANLTLELSLDESKKPLRLPCQVVQEQKKGVVWRVTVGFTLADEAREHHLLQQVLKALQKERDHGATGLIWV